MYAKPTRVLFYVQHLIGIGHLIRTAAIAAVAAANGAKVLLVSGGDATHQTLPAGVRLWQLPVARAKDARYGELLDAHGNVVDDVWRQERRKQLQALVEEFVPDAVVIETYPFGRGLLRFELEPLCEQLKWLPKPPKVWCSVRDILENKRDEQQNERILQTLDRYFDAILVHGDPAIVRLQHSFLLAHRIGIPIHYTGYVRQTASSKALLSDSSNSPKLAEPTNRSGSQRERQRSQGLERGLEPKRKLEPEIIVSAGGGVVGDDLLRVALEAHTLCQGAAKHYRWCMLAGVSLSRAARDFAKKTPLSVTIETNRSDFVQLLGQAKLSISQAGYNTVVDILATGVRAILVPFAAHGQREQPRRAALLAQWGRVRSFAADTLTAATLAAGIDRALRCEAPSVCGIDFQGAQKSAALILDASFCSK